MFRYLPVCFTRVKIDDPFWNERLRVNREMSLPRQYVMCESTGRFDALKLQWKPGQPNPPHIFWDSDTAKWLEAACYACATSPDEKLRARIEYVTDLFVNAQLPDGYLNSYFAVCETERRWKNLKYNHELYCAGHIFEAAVAHHQLTGSDRFLKVACRYADYIDSVFGIGEGKIPGYCGHEEIELALVRLYGATGEKRYLNLASYFVEQRGQKPFWFDVEAQGVPREFLPMDAKHAYFQAHLPVREQKEAVGHAVRAAYLYCGMVDLAREQKDDSLLKACETLWEDMEGSKTYITGGIGSTWQGETFGTAYDLPNERAYCETCASVALAFWAHRLLQHAGRRRYADMIERALYNGALSGMSLDGRKFFYQNPLLSFGGHHRSEWFECSCCPSNLSRLLGTLGSYLMSESEDELRVHLYVGSSMEFTLKGRTAGTLRVKGNMPWNGSVRCEMEIDKPAEFTLALRVPYWTSAPGQVSINGKSVPVRVRDGYVEISREWTSGDTVDLEFPVEIQRITSHPKLASNAGQIALQRGPFIYCIEDADFESGVLDVSLPRDAKIAAKMEKISTSLPGSEMVVLESRALSSAPPTDPALYAPVSNAVPAEISFRAVPYFAWDNRAPGAMRVWIPESIPSSASARRD